MVGIIINDSIVLVTTIDEHRRDRAVFPAIIEGACDRLRPVLLTTLTTVLGLTPLLFEQSTQAQFIKPAVITLVYGLGFGMVLVLILVPAIVAMQNDVQRYTRSMRRGLQTRKAGMQIALGSGLLLSIIWMAVTLGWTAFNGALPGFLSGLSAATDNPMPIAFVAFLVGLSVLLVLCYLAVALTRRGHQPAGQP